MPWVTAVTSQEYYILETHEERQTIVQQRFAVLDRVAPKGLDEIVRDLVHRFPDQQWVVQVDLKNRCRIQVALPGEKFFSDAHV